MLQVPHSSNLMKQKLSRANIGALGIRVGNDLREFACSDFSNFIPPRFKGSLRFPKPASAQGRTSNLIFSSQNIDIAPPGL